MVDLWILMFVPAMMAIFFLPARTLAYWEAWMYLAILIVPMLFVMTYLMKNYPDLLERRMRMREKQAEQRLIIKLSTPIFLIIFLLPGFDHRWEWSQVPAEVAITAGIFFLVVRENRFVSRIIEVEKEQTVISSEPYSIVRHPMYLGVLIMYLSSPLALGSYWGLLFSLLVIPVLVARICNEEKVLKQGLKGYREYKQTTRYRLIPGIW